MKRATKFLGILLVFIFVLTGCVTTPPTNNQPQQTGKAKFYGVINEMSFYVGEEFDPFYGITAYDAEGNNVTEYLEIFGYVPIENNILTTAGTYFYELVVIVNSKQILSENITLIVEEPEIFVPDTTKPIINANSNYSFYQGDCKHIFYLVH